MFLITSAKLKVFGQSFIMWMMRYIDGRYSSRSILLQHAYCKWQDDANITGKLAFIMFRWKKKLRNWLLLWPGARITEKVDFIMVRWKIQKFLISAASPYPTSNVLTNFHVQSFLPHSNLFSYICTNKYIHKMVTLIKLECSFLLLNVTHHYISMWKPRHHCVSTEKRIHIRPTQHFNWRLSQHICHNLQSWLNFIA